MEADEREKILDTQDPTDSTALDLYNRELNKIKLLTKDEERDLARKRKKGNLTARNELVSRNLRMVRKIALNFKRKYWLSVEEYEDLMQYGNEALITAANKFDDKRGCRFSTYATWWIKQAMYRAIAAPGLLRNDKHIPVYLDNVLKRVPYFRREFRKEHHRYPGRDELIEFMSKETRHSKDILSAVVDIDMRNYSLDAPINHEESTFMIDLIENRHSERPEASLIQIDSDEKRNRLDFHLSQLPGRLEEVIRLRFLYLNDDVLESAGLTEEDIMEMTRPAPEGDKRKGKRKKARDSLTLEQIGNIYGVSREMIRQNEEKALIELRRNMLSDPVFQSEDIDFQKEIGIVFPGGKSSVDSKESNGTDQRKRRGRRKKSPGPAKSRRRGKSPDLRLKYLDEKALDGYIGMLPKSAYRAIMRLSYGVNDRKIREENYLPITGELTAKEIAAVFDQEAANVGNIRRQCEEMIEYMREGIIPEKGDTVYDMRRALIMRKKDLAERAVSNIGDPVDREIVKMRYLLDGRSGEEGQDYSGLTLREIGDLVGVPFSHVLYRETRGFRELWGSMKLIREVGQYQSVAD